MSVVRSFINASVVSAIHSDRIGSSFHCMSWTDAQEMQLGPWSTTHTVTLLETWL